MGAEEHTGGGQAEKGWKGIPGRGNSCVKAQRLGLPSAWRAEVWSTDGQPGCLGLTAALPPS